MAGKYISKPNQSMQDVVIMATGSMEASMQFCLDNGVSISDVPVPGTEFVVSDAALVLAGAEGLAVLIWWNKEKKRYGDLGNLSNAWPPDILLNEDGTPLRNEDGSYLYSES